MDNANYKCGFVAVIGPPNAGKSTLVNAYVGEKIAIVTPKPQTTRNQIRGILTRDDLQIVFLDTPGVHKPKGGLNRALVHAAWNALSGADMVLAMLDAAQALEKPGSLHSILQIMQGPLKQCHRPIFLALNKVDRVKDKSELLPLIQSLTEQLEPHSTHPISALNGTGLDELLVEMTSLLPLGPPMYPQDQISTVPLRFMASEIIREKLFLNLKQELPYSLAVDIEQWQEDEQRLTIQATIYVTRNAHKPIVIGKRGANLKQVGQASRLEISEMLQKKVHLELWVKVKQGWVDDFNFLRMLQLTD